MRQMKKVAILTVFNDYNPQYSLCNIVVEQFKVLAKHGYNPVLIGIKGLKSKFPCPKGGIINDCLPQVYLGPEPKYVLQHFKEIKKKVLPVFEENLKDFDVILTHDIIFQEWFLGHNAAMREFAKNHPNIRWLHWLHSAPSPRPVDLQHPHDLRYSGMPNSLFISMNYTDLKFVAKMYNIPEASVRPIYNPRSPWEFFDFHPFTIQLIEKYKLMDCDILMVYPFDTTRYQAKGGDHAIRLIEAMRRRGKNAKVIFCNAWANNPQHIQMIKNKCRGKEDYVIFTSLWAEIAGLEANPEKGKIQKKNVYPYVLGVPNKVVRDLMLISNIFFLPSISEGCSIIMLEAALAKNLIILNEDFAPSKEFGEVDKVLYMKLCSERAGIRVTTQYNPSIDAYFNDWAVNIIAELERSKNLMFNRKILKEFNVDYIFKNQIEPLIEGGWLGK